MAPTIVVQGRCSASFVRERDIAAPPEKIWSLLTDSASYDDWNPAVISLDGTIALGEKIALVEILSYPQVNGPSGIEVEPEPRAPGSWSRLPRRTTAVRVRVALRHARVGDQRVTFLLVEPLAR